MLLVFRTPCQLRSLAGQEHGRTIPLADIAWSETESSLERVPDIATILLLTGHAFGNYGIGPVSHGSGMEELKAAPFEYAEPRSVDEACACLAADRRAAIIAGGQTLVPMMAMRLARPTRLIDIARHSRSCTAFVTMPSDRHRRGDASGARRG